MCTKEPGKHARTESLSEYAHRKLGVHHEQLFYTALFSTVTFQSMITSDF